MAINCSLCQMEAEFLFDAKDTNRKISDKTFAYYRCTNCELVFLPHIPEDLDNYYSKYFNLPTPDELIQIAAGEKFKIEMVKKFISSGKLLEIGPSIGVFTHQAKQAGFEVDAIEMSSECCEFLSQVVGINTVNSDDPAEALKNMEAHDIIVLWHNIEHLPDPWTCLQQISQNLTMGGILIIATPNPISFGFRYTSQTPAHTVTDETAPSNPLPQARRQGLALTRPDEL